MITTLMTMIRRRRDASRSVEMMLAVFLGVCDNNVSSDQSRLAHEVGRSSQTPFPDQPWIFKRWTPLMPDSLPE